MPDPNRRNFRDNYPGVLPSGSLSGMEQTPFGLPTDIEKKLDGDYDREVLPSDVEVLITRNYGETANDKVNELVEHLTLAVIIVIGLIALARWDGAKR